MICAPPLRFEFDTEQKLIDHASFENQVERDPSDDALYSEACRKAAALDFVFFLENLETLRWCDIEAAVARSNRG